MSPFVTNLVEPPPPYVTGPNSDKLFFQISFGKVIEEIVNRYMEYVFIVHISWKISIIMKYKNRKYTKMLL